VQGRGVLISPMETPYDSQIAKPILQNKPYRNELFAVLTTRR